MGLADTIRVDGASLVVNEVRVLDVRTALRGSSPMRRATQMAEFLRRAPVDGQARAMSAENESRVMIGTQLIARVSRAEAQAHNTSTAELASRWASQLNQARTLPPVQLDVSKVRTPPGGSRSVAVIGSHARTATVFTLDPLVAVVERNGALITVRSAGVGKTVVRFEGGGQTLDLPVEVLPWAVELPQTFSASVMGAPSLEETVRTAALGAVRTRLRTRPNARVDILGTDAAAIAVGASRQVAVRVRVVAPGAYEREGRLLVQVRNEAIPILREAELWYCNDPENVPGPRELFAAPLLVGHPARMLYHHINASRAELAVLVWVKNPYDLPARLALIPGDGAPHTDPVRVGLQAAEHYLRAWLSGSGEILEVPARSAAPIALRRLAPGKTMSGLCGLHLLPGGPDRLLVRADALPTSRVPAPWLGGAGSATPWAYAVPRPLNDDEVSVAGLTDHVYPQPFRSIDASFYVGGRFTFVRIGQQPLPNASENRKLEGNFGVVYQVRATLRNPTERPAEVEIAFEASAGYSAALFVVDGVLDRPRLLQSKEEVVVRAIRLRPGEERRVDLMTVPLSGSSYPATLTLRPRDLKAFDNAEASRQ